MKPTVFTQWARPATVVSAASLAEPVGPAQRAADSRHRAASAASQQQARLAPRGLSDRALAW
ncbi:MAG TPA: hypothetical protein VNN06_04045, partial [Ramlibacter sp.]|nr:hypothetical protein [Ramlibacter sp.]